MSIVGKIDFLLGEDLALENKQFKMFFKKKLKKFGVDEPDKLSTAKKKKFFQEVEDEWKAKNEGLLTEASLEAIMMQYGPYAAGKKMGILNPKESGKAGEVKQYPGSGKEHFHPEKTDQKIAGDKTDVKGYPGKHDVNYQPTKVDQKIAGDKTDVKGFPGKHDVNYRPEKQDVKIAGNKGDVKGYPGDPEAHYDPNKQDVKIPTKDKGAVKSFPGDGKEHFKPEAQDAKIAGDKTDVKGWDDAKVRHDKTVLGFDRDTRSDQTDPKPMTEMLENPNKSIFEAYKKIIADQSTDDVEEIQGKFGPKKYADEAGLSDKNKKKKKKKEEKDTP